MPTYRYREFERQTEPVPEFAGTIKWYDPSKGYGFVLPAGGGNDVFLHQRIVRERVPQKGERVLFALGHHRGRAEVAALKFVP